MAATAGPHQSSLANKLDPRVDSSTGTTTAAGSAADTSSRGTGPAPTTAGPHKSDTANKLDPRVDSDLNNQAQYAPGTTTTGDNHPGATQPMSNPESSSSGPHSSNVLNKLDPRVNSKTGETTAKTTNETGTKTPTNTSGVVQGSSTGAPAVPSSQTSTKAGDNAKNAPQTSRGNYNPSTGTGFDPPSGGSKGKGTTVGSSTTSSGGTDIGQSIKAAAAGIHVRLDPFLYSVEMVLTF